MPKKRKNKSKKKGKNIVDKNKEAGSMNELSGDNMSLNANSDSDEQPKEYLKLGDAISHSVKILPLLTIQYMAKKYINIVNNTAERYLAIVGVDPKSQGEDFNRQISRATELFSTYIKIAIRSSSAVFKEALKVGNEIMKDKELMMRLDRFMKAATEVASVYMKAFIKLSDEGIPLIREQGEKYVEVIQNTGENAGKAGIRAGLNAMQAVPGLGQALSVVRMIHSITMPFFTFQRKMSNLAIKTGEDLIRIAERNQVGAVLGLEKTIKLVKEGMDAQDTAARKVNAYTQKIKEKIEGAKADLNKVTNKAQLKPQVPQQVQQQVQQQVPQQVPQQSAGYRRRKRRRRRTKKRTLKKRHRRKTRRRKRRKSRRSRR